MQHNPMLKTFFDKLYAAGVQHRCNWQAKRDPRAKHFDVEHLSFVGDGFAPSIATAIVIDYGPRDGFGIYVDTMPNDFDGIVAEIAKPRAATLADAPDDTTAAIHERNRIADALDAEAEMTPASEDAAVVRSCAQLVRANFSYEDAERLDILADAPNDTVDALMLAEEFITGFEDDETQEGVADMLAGLRAAIARERAKPDMLAALKVAEERIEINNLGDEEDEYLATIRAAIAAAEGRAPTPEPDPRAAFIDEIARLSASGDLVDLDGEEWPNGYQHDTGNSLDALDELIHKARAIAGIAAPTPEPEDEEEDEDRFTNFYRCEECDTSWEDNWSCACDDECPECGRDFTPYKSIDNKAEG